MKDTNTILTMLAKAREDILKEKSSKSKTGDAFVVFMKKKGERCAKEVFAYNWNGNRDEYDDDFILSGRGWNLYKDGERKYRLYDCEYGEEYEIDNPQDIDALEQHLYN